MEHYLYTHYKEEIKKILESPKKAKIHELLLDLSQLKENSTKFYKEIINTSEYNKIANKWIKAIKNVQQDIKDEILGGLNAAISTPHGGNKKNFSNASTALLDVDDGSVSLMKSIEIISNYL